MKLKEKLRENNLLLNDKGYFNSYKDNIFDGEMDKEFQDMFDSGSGGELHSKAEAIHSSSMLSYNIFHIIKKNPITFRGVTYNDVLFEVKLQTIKGSPAPANMDVVLIGKKEGKTHVMFIESKFLEYVDNKKSELSESYANENKWLVKNVDWLNIINAQPSTKGYHEGIKQAITHLFGIHNLLINPVKVPALKLVNIEKTSFEFVNMIYEPNESYEESNSYDNYKTFYSEFVNKIKDVKGLQIIPKWISYSEWWKDTENQYPKNLRSYINERYMQYAKKQ
jgi:hypothetical protein